MDLSSKISETVSSVLSNVFRIDIDVKCHKSHEDEYSIIYRMETTVLSGTPYEKWIYVDVHLLKSYSSDKHEEFLRFNTYQFSRAINEHLLYTRFNKKVFDENNA